jgi:prepilin-type N-terminal cleavage/methylation domain-containing protein
MRTKTLAPSLSRRAGFSLMELSIVLLIIALVGGAGLGMATNALKAADRISTQEKLATIKLALDSHGKTYGYLPCPASFTLTPTSTSFGMESRSGPPGTACTIAAPGVVGAASNTVIIGAVPVRTLGLPDSYAGDAWGSKLTYAVGSLMVAGPNSYTSSAGSLSVRSGNRGTFYSVTQRRNSLAYTSVATSGGLIDITFASPHGIGAPGTLIMHVAGTVYSGSYTISSIPSATRLVLAGTVFSATDTGTVTWQDGGAAASFVVLSHGADRRGAYPLNGSAIPAAGICTGAGAPEPCASLTTCIDIENCNHSDEIFYDTTFNDGPIAAQYFDDYVAWGSNELYRTTANPTLYAAGCPTGTCEAWCAKCSTHYPGGTTTPPTGGNLCRKVISSNATACEATCFWGGTIGAGYVKCQ